MEEKKKNLGKEELDNLIVNCLRITKIKESSISESNFYCLEIHSGDDIYIKYDYDESIEVKSEDLNKTDDELKEEVEYKKNRIAERNRKIKEEIEKCNEKKEHGEYLRLKKKFEK